jgi:hypothetical protein
VVLECVTLYSAQTAFGRLMPSAYVQEEKKKQSKRIVRNAAARREQDTPATQHKRFFEQQIRTWVVRHCPQRMSGQHLL